MIKNVKYNYYIGFAILFTLMSISGFNSYKKKKDLRTLEKLADIDNNGVLDSTENSIIYKMCNTFPKKSTCILTINEIQRGIENYKLKKDSINKDTLKIKY